MNVTSPIDENSTPSRIGGWFGASATLTTTRAPTSMTSDSPARDGKFATARIRERLIEIATTTSPVSVASAPSSAEKKACQSEDSEFIFGSDGNARRESPHHRPKPYSRPTRDRANRRRAG